MLNPALIIKWRLVNQEIAESNCSSVSGLLSRMLVMQAQEYAMAKWAIGLRLKDAVEEDVENAFNKGTILRTHLMRPTWHFISPEDIRWVLALTAPYVHAFNSTYYRKSELNTLTFKKSLQVIEKALKGGRALSRKEIQAALAREKIRAEKERLGLILMFAELEALICSGSRKQNQFTYALLEERVPKTKPKGEDEALAELCSRYFASRGPATVYDFAWWSGLSVSKAREGISALPKDFLREKMGKEDYLFLPPVAQTGSRIQSTFILPDYDEYGISYKNREVLDRKNGTLEMEALDLSFNHYLIIDGKVGGKWKKTIGKQGAMAEATCFQSLSKTKAAAVSRAIKKYNRFFQSSATGKKPASKK